MESMTVSILTYNLLYNKALSYIKPLIAQHKPDILCFQEMETHESSFKEIENCGYRLADYSNSFIRFGKIFGVTTFFKTGKFYLGSSLTIHLPRSLYEVLSHLFRFFNSNYGPRTVLRTTLISQELKKEITVYNVHLTMWGANGVRLKQVKETLEDLNVRNGNYSVILAGDFNYIPYARKKLEEILEAKHFQEATKNINFTIQYSPTGVFEQYNIFQKVLTRLISKVGINKFKIDYVFYKNLTHLKTEKIEVRFSDHFPIVSTFEI